MKRIILIAFIALVALVACELPAPTPTGEPGATDTPTATVSPVVSSTPTATATPTSTPTATPDVVPGLGANLFVNPGFEGGWYHQTFAEIYIGDGWFFTWNDEEGQGRPEAKPGDAALYPNDAYGGRFAQQWFCFFRPCQAAIAQGIDTIAGYEYLVTARIKTWSSYQIRDENGNVIDDDPESEIDTEDDRRASQWAIKIDLDGGIYPDEADVVCPVVGFAHYDNWVEVSCSFVATDTRTTIFFENTRLWGLRNQDSYVDETFVGCYDCPAQTPWVTPTPIATPGPTSTPAPTATPIPVEDRELDSAVRLLEGTFTPYGSMNVRAGHSTGSLIIDGLIAGVAVPVYARWQETDGMTTWYCIDPDWEVIPNEEYNWLAILDCHRYVAGNISGTLYGELNAVVVEY